MADPVASEIRISSGSLGTPEEQSSHHPIDLLLLSTDVVINHSHIVVMAASSAHIDQGISLGGLVKLGEYTLWWTNEEEHASECNYPSKAK